LKASEFERYGRQIMIRGFGEKGQRKLKEAKVLVAGAGGLGCPASLYLAAAGVGNLIIVDDDKVELSNLNRQILHWSNDVGRDKSFSAAEKLKLLNPEIRVVARSEAVARENSSKLVRGCSAVVDGMDNWSTRYILNEACVKERIPFVHAGIYGLYGQITTIMPGEGPCLQCIIPKTPSEVKGFPVLGTTPGTLGLLEALETIKLITGVGKPLVGRLLSVDGEDVNFQMVKVERNPRCPVCGHL